MSRLIFTDTPIAGLTVVQRRLLEDSRGFFSRLFCEEELSAVGWKKKIVQINQSYTKKQGTIRGLHYQKSPNTEMKLVTCLHGAVWDVAVDLRCGSPTYLKWYAHELSAENCQALLIPDGFAHGFQTLTENCELIYFHSSAYTPAAELGLNATDPHLSITWPQVISELSNKDSQYPMINQNFDGVKL
jgi:dTDP-4-dehydrorhamnose 3,5-epimerase